MPSKRTNDSVDRILEELSHEQAERVRLLGMLFSPLVWDSFFCAAVTCGAA